MSHQWSFNPCISRIYREAKNDVNHGRTIAFVAEKGRLTRENAEKVQQGLKLMQFLVQPRGQQGRRHPVTCNWCSCLWIWLCSTIDRLTIQSGCVVILFSADCSLWIRKRWVQNQSIGGKLIGRYWQSFSRIRTGAVPMLSDWIGYDWSNLIVVPPGWHAVLHNSIDRGSSRTVQSLRAAAK